MEKFLNELQNILLKWDVPVLLKNDELFTAVQEHTFI